MKRQVVVVVSIFLAVLVLRTTLPMSAQQAELDPAVAAQVGKALSGHRIAEPPPQTRGGNLSQLYWAAVPNVPVVVGNGGIGSSVVLSVSKSGQASVITNDHVAEHAITYKGTPVMFLLFYESALKNEYFDYGRFVKCVGSSSVDQTDWCRAVRSSSRLARVVRTDPSRDLALLSVDSVPSGVTGFQSAANIQTMQPGDPVAVIGHPEDLLWSLTTGIISAVRGNFPLGNGSGTVIQIEAPVNPGNSGGPLIGADGKIAGVVFAHRVGAAFKVGDQAVTVPAPGLNYAIGVDEVLTFLRSIPK